MRKDDTTPDTRLADDPMNLNPATVGALMQLMRGGLPPDRASADAFQQLAVFRSCPAPRRYSRRCRGAGRTITGESVTVTLVNINQSRCSGTVVQAGGYAEHQFDSVEWNGQTVPLNAREFQIPAHPGRGSKAQAQDAAVCKSADDTHFPGTAIESGRLEPLHLGSNLIRCAHLDQYRER